jgi:hypothetical protein
MKTTIYWTTQHSRCVVHDFCFRATCWWLRQQVEFLDWRMRLDAPSPLPHSEPAPHVTEPVRAGAKRGTYSYAGAI